MRNSYMWSNIPPQLRINLFNLNFARIALNHCYNPQYFIFEVTPLEIKKDFFFSLKKPALTLKYKLNNTFLF